jgi:iron complex transport system substrate-binding protein
MRIVSLLPAATEMVAALGAAELLAGVTHECDYPADAADRPRVTRSSIPSHGPDGSPPDPAAVDEAVRALSAGGLPLFALDEPAIAALRPDLFLTQALCDVCAVWEGDVRALATRLRTADGAEPRVATLGGTSLDGVFDDVQRVAAAIDRAGDGAALVATLRARLSAVHERLKAARAPRPRVAVVEWTAPVFLAGHWGPEMVKRAGGVDVLGVAGAHSTTVTLEALAGADPEAVIIAPCGYDLPRATSEARGLLDDPQWAWLHGRPVWAVDANAFVSRPAPRLVDGVELFAQLLHPSLFGAPDPARAARVA